VDTGPLLDAARAGDRRALDDLCARHRGRLLAFVASRLGEGLAATPEDVVQETYLEAVRKIDGFEPQGPSAFYRWLVAIARFKVAETIRARQARKRALEAPLAHEPAARQTSPSARAGKAEGAALLARALDGIEPAQAEAIRLRYLEGLSILEAADRMERTEAAVKALVARGLDALSAILPRPSAPSG
jgi:RNA polymerase sigma-70 factor (ECF subfamily)